MTKVILKSLEDYTSREEEQIPHQKIINLIHSKPDCFWRNCYPSHITGSALLINQTGDKALLNYHKFLNKWLSFGGHADGNTDIFDTAQRETEEESGISNFKDPIGGIFDLDIHPIPSCEKKNEPVHEHYDITYLLQCTDDSAFKISDESIELRWCTYEEALNLVCNNNQFFDGLSQNEMAKNRMARLLNKWHIWEKDTT